MAGITSNAPCRAISIATVAEAVSLQQQDSLFGAASRGSFFVRAPYGAPALPGLG
ncbi:hypothetical protein GCM10007167_05310 [Vulcaniibacterium thermophilum]|uniref:Uncharacterized protein n=1 Tax=Vulcaniibacterium thermophilum TaxID=1169913 RepID=A0A918YWU8_9GAMM|nr:hypothetical protein GCM10007167_05310 [Vulcaniibacterium thermophilum]